jgi:hypothetical protein
METVIGFIAGFLIGSREGKEGVERLRASWQAIKSSPEVRRLAGQAVSVAEGTARRASLRGLGAVGEGILRALTERPASGRRYHSRAV